MYQTLWQYSDGDPVKRLRIQVDRQKSWFWANIWLRRVLWTRGATDHGELMTLVAGKRWSLLMAGDDDEVYDKKRQRYAEDNRTAFNCTQW